MSFGYGLAAAGAGPVCAAVCGGVMGRLVIPSPIMTYRQIWMRAMAGKATNTHYWPMTATCRPARGLTHINTGLS